MEDFKALVESCRKWRKNRRITNLSRSNAKILFDNLFLIAFERNEDIKIVSGNLDPEFYGGFVDYANRCMDKGIKIDVVITDPKTKYKDNPFAVVVINHEYGTLCRAPSGGEIIHDHYLLVGDSRYRLETDHEKSEAIANFNDDNVGTFLLKSFGHIQGECKVS